MILRIWPGRIPFPRGSDGKCGRPGSIPGLGRSPGGGHGNPLQYSCLDNPMDRGAWRAAVHGLAKSQTPLNNKAQHIYKIMSLCMISFLNFFFNFLFSIVVQPVNNVVIVSGVQQRDQPQIHMHPFSPKLPSSPGCHITLSRVPCAIYLYIPVQALVGCPFRIQQCVHVHPQLPNYPFPSSFPLATISSFSKSASLFLFLFVHFLFLYVHFYHFFLDSTYKGCHTIFLFLRLTYST